MKKRMKYICCLLLAASLTAGLMAGCGNENAGTQEKDQQEEKGEGEKGSTQDAVKLNPDKPISITIWHYYNGAQQVAFDELVNEFNESVGKERHLCKRLQPGKRK